MLFWNFSIHYSTLLSSNLKTTLRDGPFHYYDECIVFLIKDDVVLLVVLQTRIIIKVRIWRAVPHVPRIIITVLGIPLTFWVLVMKDDYPKGEGLLRFYGSHYI